VAKAKKAAAKTADTKPITDVAHPGTTAPSDTSKSIITSRPMIKDPMVVEDDKPDEDKETLVKKTAETKIIPPEEKAAEGTEPDDGKAVEPEEPAKPEENDKKSDEADDKAAATEPDIEPDDGKTDEKDRKPSKSEPGDKDAEAKDAKLQQLVDNKKYFLPINAVEHRRSKRVVIGGVVLALLLTVAWADIALDASLIQVNGVKPVTHFFSN
jgi:hypothetical protein